MADGTIGTVTLNSGSGVALTLAGTTNLTFDIGQSGADQLVIADGTVSFTGTPQDNIILDPLAGNAPTSLSSIPLISAPNGALVLGDFSLPASTVTFGGSLYNASLSLGGAGGDTELLVSLSLAGSANYYFTGVDGASWSTIGNFATDHTGGTAQSALPGPTSNIFLTADTASNNPINYESETIDGNYSINSLSFTGTDSAVGNTPAATAGISLGGGSATAPLVILAANAIQDTNGNNYAAGTGVVVQAGSAGHTISANIDLGNSQAWEIDNSGSNALTVSGVIADGSTLDSLTKTGTGTLIFANANTYDGGTFVDAGTLMLGSGGSLLATGALTVEGTGTFDLAGQSQTVGSLSDGGVSTGIITSSTGTSTSILTLNNTAPISYGGMITDNNAGDGASLALVLEGSSTVTLSGSSNFTGGTTLNSGNLTVASNYALGSATSANANAGLTLNNAGTVNVFFTSSNPTIASLNTGVGANLAENIILGNATGVGSATTLNIGGGGLAQSADGTTFSGTISDLTGTVGTAAGNLNVFGGGYLILSGSDTFTGTTTITGSNGSLQSEINVNNSYALGNSTLNYNNQGGFIEFSVPSATLGGITGSENLSLLANGSGALTLTLGNNNVSSNYSGALIGPGGIIKAGTGTLTLTGTNDYLGSTTENLGTLVVTNTLGNASNPTGSITIAGGTFDVTGASVYTSLFTEDSGPNSGSGTPSAVNIGLSGSGGTLVISGALAVDANNGDQNSPFSIFGGSVTAASATIGRGNSNQGGAPGLLGTTADGIYVDGGTLSISGNLNVGSTQPSSAVMRMDAGAVTVDGVTTISNGAASRFSVLDINGGTFSAESGFLLGGNTDSGALDAELLIENGILNASGITLGGSAQTSGIDEFLASGGTTTIGSGGIVSGNPTGTTLTVALGFSTLSTAPTIGASASWSSNVPFTLSNSIGGTAPIFQTATGDNITLTAQVSGTGGLTASGSGVLTLSGPNTYSGITTINGGILNAGSSTALGASPAITFTGGTLQYSGSNNVDYSALFVNSTSPISIDTHSRAVTYATAFAGSNSGGLSVVDSAGGGSLTLTAANTYTGATTIGAGGNLILASTASLGNTAITVGSGGTLSAQAGTGDIQIGTNGASLDLGVGSSFSMVDGFVGTVTLNSSSGTALVLSGTTGTPTSLSFDLGSAGADQLIVNNGTVSFAASNALDEISIFPIAGSAAPGTLTNIPIISVPNGVLNLNDFVLQTTTLTLAGTFYTAGLTLGGAGGDTELLLSLAAGGSANDYFTGAQSATWGTIGNFATDNTGAVAQSGSIGALNNIFLTADTASSHPARYETETLDGNYTINSLSFTGTDVSVGNTPAANASILLENGSATAPLEITGTNSFNDANGNTYAAGTGVVVQAESAAHTIAANIQLGNSQTWEIDNSSADPLTMTGSISDGTTLDSLTKTGSGTLILSDTNTYDGGTIVKAGTLALGMTNALAPATGLTVQGTGIFDLAGNSQTLANLSDGGVSTGIITSSTGTATITLNNNSPNTFSGGITDGNLLNGASLSLVLSGTSVVTISGSNSYTGLTTVNAGALVASNNHSLGSSTSGTGGLVMTPTVAASVHFTSGSPSIASLASGGGGTSTLFLGNSSGGGSATTLTVTGAGSGLGTIFGGDIVDLTSTIATAVGSLAVTGGMLTLDGSDTFTGTTAVSGGGTLILGNVAALEDSVLNYTNQGGTLSFGTLTAANIADLSGSQNLALANTGAAGVALTVGAPALIHSTTYSGALSGGGSLTISGSTTGLTLTGANSYTGTTTVTSGTLTITNALGTSSSPTGAITIASTSTTGGAVLNLTNALVYASTLSTESPGVASPAGTGSTVNISGTSSVNISGNVAVDENNAEYSGLVAVTGSSTLSANSISIGRDGLADTAIPTAATTTDGLYVNGGTVDIATTLNVNGGGNSTSTFRMDAGSVTVGTTATVTINNGNRWSIMQINGGDFTSNDISGGGIVVGGTYAAGNSLLLVSGGTVNTNTITLGDNTTQDLGTDEFEAEGGATYIGDGGIVSGTFGSTDVVAIGSATVTTQPVIAASAPWSSSVPMTLTNNSNGTRPTFQTQDSIGNAQNITLSGALTGSGGMTKTGAGTLTLSGSDSYAGATAVNVGTLIVSGSLTGTVSASVAAGATMEVDGAVNGSATTTLNGGELTGIGSVGGITTTSGEGSTLAPGLSSAPTPAAGILIANGPVTLDSSANFSIRLGVAIAGDSDQLDVPAFDQVTLNNANLELSSGTFISQLIGFIYVIINGDSASNGLIVGEFAQGTSITASNGYTCDILYNVNSTNTGAGDDVDLELVAAVPEPGTWAMVIAGIGMLIVWRRSRSRRA
jgi:autotransporter-associated beta strand protein